MKNSKTVKAAAIAIFIGFAIASAVPGLVNIKTLGWFTALILVLVLLIMSVAGALLAVSMIKGMAKLNFWLAAAFVSGVPAVIMFYNMKLPGTLMVYFTIAVCCMLVGGSLVQLGKRWGGLKKFHKALTIVCLVIGVTGIAGGLTWMIYPGKQVEIPLSAANSAQNMPPVLEMSNPGESGQYEVAYLTYGSGKDKHRKVFQEEADLITQPVDGSTFLDSWKGFSGKMRTRFFGFDKDSLPLNAQVWYPQGDGPFPLVLIVHGNHSAQDYSDPGYEYLGRMLASKGYIMASVDENFLNGSYTDIPKGLSGENNVRGWLLLKHLEVWRQWNGLEDNPFYGKVDMDRIALIGHSRGGEAVAHAALFNRLPYYPDDANEVFDFNFNIRSVIAIAPCDGQYQPGSMRTPLTDINYLVLQGSHDADVSSYQGMRQFNRLRFSEGFDGFAAGLYIWGANHGQFNSSWGRTDFPSPRINFYNLGQLMSQEDQQTISKTYIGAFLDATLRDHQALRPMFTDYRYARHWLPETVYLSQYRQPGTLSLGTFAEDLDLTTATLAQSRAFAEDLSIWREQALHLSWGDSDTRALFLGWNTTKSDTLAPAYHITWPDGALNAGQQSILTFSLAELDEKANPPGAEDAEVDKGESSGEGAGEGAENEKDSIVVSDSLTLAETDKPFIDFTIRLTDRDGSVLEFPLSDFAPLQHPLKRKMTKLGFMQPQAKWETVLQTYSFPLQRYAGDHPEFDFGHITGMSFLFNLTPEGVIVVNEIGVR
jgi:dienelactone hydrolase